MEKSKDKPILFNTDMVQAILEGRKTVTRRVIKQQPDNFTHSVKIISNALTEYDEQKRSRPTGYKKSPYSPGHVLWVRETWSKFINDNNKNEYVYKADFPQGQGIWKWKPSIFMPRDACRLLLEVVSVRAERLQDITATACREEGINEKNDEHAALKWVDLWDSINEKRGYPWESNPWVWRIEFKRIER